MEINAGASSFSDWWAYKFEVYDAIPYNGALLAKAGVLTSFNSDDNELARRLNTEAAKAIKYGGMSEEVALQFVTLNPAKQLRIDDRVGSLEPGKDADFVLWTDHPLSTYAVAEQTWIDGIKYFDRNEDCVRQQLAVAERARLIQKILKRSKSKAGHDSDDKQEKLSADEETSPVSAGHDSHASEYDDDFIYHNGAGHHDCASLEGEEQ